MKIIDVKFKIPVMVKKLVTLTHSETLAYLSVKWVDFISQFISVQCNLIRCNSIHHRMLSYSFAWNLKFYLQVISTPPDLHKSARILSVQFSSVAQWCPTLCNPMNRSTPGLPFHHQLPKSAGSQREEFRPWQRSWGRKPDIRKGVIWLQGSACFIALYFPLFCL